MKVRFCCDSGANIHSCNKSDWMDTVEDLGLEDGEWEEMTYDEKHNMIEEWANNYLEIYYEEREND